MRPEESVCEYRMIFVSTRFPEEIPWFNASRRVVVAAMFKGNPRHLWDLYHAIDPPISGIALKTG